MRVFNPNNNRLHSLISKLRYNFIPVTNYDLSKKPNPMVAVHIGHKSSTIGTLNFRFFENIVPKTAQNYRRLLLGIGQYQGRKLSLINTGVHKVYPRAYIQMGHLPEGNCSIFGPTFRDQSFELLHERPGLLTSISEQNSNNSRFGITLGPCPYLDYKCVVFGQISKQSMGFLKDIEKMGSKIRQLTITGTQNIEVKQVVDDHDHHH